MGERSSYGPGTFCWVDLPSRDPELSKRFYSAILQWEYDERTGAVSVAERYHARVAAIFGADERVRVRRVQQWQNFISVNDADATSARAADLGGSVEVEPFDVSLACRAAAITDPTGALFWLWQPRRHAGAARVNDPGCFTWNELHTSDPAAASRFYSKLFGWRFDQVSEQPPYWTIHHAPAANGRNGGMREGAPDGQPSMWIPYFTVESTPRAVETAQAAGGHLRYGIATVNQARIAVMQDPTGAWFGLYEGPVDD